MAVSSSSFGQSLLEAAANLDEVAAPVARGQAVKATHVPICPLPFQDLPQMSLPMYSIVFLSLENFGEFWRILENFGEFWRMRMMSFCMFLSGFFFLMAHQSLPFWCAPSSSGT